MSCKFSFRDGKLRVDNLTLSVEDTEALYRFLSTARRLHDHALQCQGETVVYVQRFVAEAGEPCFIVGDTIDSSKLDENDMVSFMATARLDGETEEDLLDRLGLLDFGVVVS